MRKGLLDPESRELFYVSTENVLRAAPAAHPGEPTADSVLVLLD
jgi:hypothetical protein